MKCAGREYAGRPTDSSVESAGLPTESPAGRLADSLPAHFIGATSGYLTLILRVLKLCYNLIIRRSDGRRASAPSSTRSPRCSPR